MSTPDVLAACLEKPTQAQVDHVAQRIVDRGVESVLFVGHGSSYSAGMTNTHVVETVAGLPARNALTSTVGAYPPIALNEKTVMIVSSHSGRTPGDVAVMKMAKERGAYTVAISDIPGSPLAETVDDAIIGPCGPKAEMPAGRTYAAAMFSAFQLAVAVASRSGRTELATRYMQELRALPEQYSQFLSAFEPKALQLAKVMADWTAVFVLAAGPNMSTATEGALAMLQATGIGAQPYQVEDFLHGPLQGMEATMGVIIAAAPGPQQARMFQVAEACAVIGAPVMIMAPKGCYAEDDSLIHIDMPVELDELLSPMLYIAPIWQVGYHYSLLAQRHPDNLGMVRPEFQKAMGMLMSTGSKFGTLIGPKK